MQSPWKVVKSMIGESVNNKYLWISIGVLTLFYWLDSGIMMADGYVFEMIHEINSLGSAQFIMPMACALPAALGYYEEKQTNNYRYKIIRKNRLSYAVRSVGKGMAAGGLVIAVSMALLLGAFFVISAAQGNAVSFMDDSGIYGTVDDPTIYTQLFEHGFGAVVLILNVLMMILHGMLWPCFGILASAFINNRKLLLVFPFLLYRLFAYIYNVNEYLTPLSFDMKLSIVYEPFGGFLRVGIYMLVVIYITVVALMMNMNYQYQRGE